MGHLKLATILTLPLLLTACGDSSSAGAGGTGTTGTTTGATTGATTGTTTSAQSTGTGSAANCTPPCMNYVSMPVMGCAITQAVCEQNCQDAIGKLPATCSGQYLAFLQCTSTAPRTSFTCMNGGPLYNGMECNTEKAALSSCVTGG